MINKHIFLSVHLYNLSGVRDKKYHNLKYYYLQKFKRNYGNNLRLKIPTFKKKENLY